MNNQNSIVCITDSTEREQYHFLLPSNCNLERLREEFLKNYHYSTFQGCIVRSNFISFIKEKGAVEIQVETLDIPSYGDD